MSNEVWPEVTRSLTYRYDSGFCIDRGGIFIAIRDKALIRRFRSGAEVFSPDGRSGRVLYVDRDGYIRVKWYGGTVSKETEDSLCVKRY